MQESSCWRLLWIQKSSFLSEMLQSPFINRTEIHKEVRVAPLLTLTVRQTSRCRAVFTWVNQDQSNITLANPKGQKLCGETLKLKENTCIAETVCKCAMIGLDLISDELRKWLDFLMTKCSTSCTALVNYFQPWWRLLNICSVRNYYIIMPNYSCIFISSYLWSIKEQMHIWFHYHFLFLYFIIYR